MKKTLILCFIHGFQGGEETFGNNYEFTEHLRRLVAEALPKIDVQVLVYPKFETRGDLGVCVSRFRDWLQEKVIDIEVAAKTPSPTVDPSVRTILVGHSMGGIVAAETVIGLTSERPIYTEDGVEKSEKPDFNAMMFPYIQGVLAFDTPYLGIAPGVVAHSAEGHYQTAAATFSQLSGLGASLWGAKQATQTPAKRPAGALPPASSQSSSSSSRPQPQSKSSSSWGNWGKVAMYGGAAAAVAAGGAAAWVNRDHITESWSWVSSHLSFVGCLARPEELKKRVSCMVQLNREIDVGFANLYTRLGRAASSKQVSAVGTVLGHDRTFCNLPSKMEAGMWRQAVNDKAEDEVGAHIGMFEPKENPGYEKLAQDATGIIATWLQNDWYQTSAPAKPMLEDGEL